MQPRFMKIVLYSVVCLNSSIQAAVARLNGQVWVYDVEGKAPAETKISGIVRDPNGQPLAGVTLTTLPFSLMTVSTGDQGRFELRCPTRHIGSEETGFLLIAQHKQRNLALTKLIEEASSDLDLKLELGLILYGQVVDPNGNPLGRGSALPFIRYGHSSTNLGRESQCGEDGRYRINAIPRGYQYSVEVSAPGFGSTRYQIHSDEFENGTMDLGPLSLVVADLSLGGRVVDVNDRPLVGVRVNAHGPGQPQDLDTQTDPNGTFAFDKVCAGPISIFAYMPLGGPVTGNIETEGGATDLKVVMRDQSGMSWGFERAQSKSLVGKPLPDVNQVGITVPPSELADKPILLCFWDVQQRPARRCLLKLKQQAQVLREKGIEVMAIQSTEVSPDILDAWLKKNNLPFRLGALKGNTKETMFNWGIKAIPWLILTDKEHKVIAEGFAWAELDEKLEGSNIRPSAATEN